MIYCSNCGLANRDNSRFCNECGQRLGEWLDCPHCRFQNLSTARFCNQCGGQLHSVRTPSITAWAPTAPPSPEDLPLEAEAPTVPELLAPVADPIPEVVTPAATLPVMSPPGALPTSLPREWRLDETVPAEISDSDPRLPAYTPAYGTPEPAAVELPVVPVVPEQPEPQEEPATISPTQELPNWMAEAKKAAPEPVSVSPTDRVRPLPTAVQDQSQRIGQGIELSRASDAALVGSVSLAEASAGQFVEAGALFGPILASWQPTVAAPATKKRRAEPRKTNILMAVVVAIVVVGLLGVALFFGDLFPQIVSQR